MRSTTVRFVVASTNILQILCGLTAIIFGVWSVIWNPGNFSRCFGVHFWIGFIYIGSGLFCLLSTASQNKNQTLSATVLQVFCFIFSLSLLVIACYKTVDSSSLVNFRSQIFLFSWISLTGTGFIAFGCGFHLTSKIDAKLRRSLEEPEYTPNNDSDPELSVHPPPYLIQTDLPTYTVLPPYSPMQELHPFCTFQPPNTPPPTYASHIMNDILQQYEVATHQQEEVNATNQREDVLHRTNQREDAVNPTNQREGLLEATNQSAEVAHAIIHEEETINNREENLTRANQNEELETIQNSSARTASVQSIQVANTTVEPLNLIEERNARYQPRNQCSLLPGIGMTVTNIVSDVM